MNEVPSPTPDTELANPQSDGLDLLDAESIIRVIHEQDTQVPRAIEREIPQIARVVDRVADAFRAGGRLHYFGAGTSGRLGILDASEMHPTFGVPTDLVQGHIAGGDRAIRTPVEGAEDDRSDGSATVTRVGVQESDVVVAISASGRAPWCIGVLEAARRVGAFTVALTCNRSSPMAQLCDVHVCPEVGQEVITGSTRMKSGTAQKLVLNMISTGAMVRTGFTFGNLMVGLVPSNEKLKERARRLVRQITGATDVESTLDSTGWNVREACLVILRHVSPANARSLLKDARGSLRRALESSSLP